MPSSSLVRRGSPLWLARFDADIFLLIDPVPRGYIVQGLLAKPLQARGNPLQPQTFGQEYSLVDRIDQTVDLFVSHSGHRSQAPRNLD